ncbi:nanos homolog 3-like [Patiria miniata]|uniref:Nanos-type domain-containing protein n=1 Tax=Patiria miniata TaxID=46514 RepID=A0A913Z571_PATMI|nr:nanos homolog 3-like [Patiria miniata]
MSTSFFSSLVMQDNKPDLEMPVTEPRDFDRFHDYLGLARLITKTSIASPRPTSVSESSEDQFLGLQTPEPGQETSSIDSGSTMGFRPFTIDELSRDETCQPSRRGNRWMVPKPTWCVFCKNNGESEAVYTSHILKNSLDKVVCPRLRAYICPLCGTSGDEAHTIKYCPTNLGSLQPAPSKSRPSNLGMFISSRLLPSAETRVSV